LGSEDGMSLPEVLIGLTIGLLVVGAAVSVFTSALRTQPRLSERAAQIQQARTMAERLSRELRQGSNAISTSSSNLAVLTYLPRTTCGTGSVGPATRCKVFYGCSAGTCTRTECGPNALTIDGTCGPTVTAVTGLADTSVFAFTPRVPGQAFVSIRLAFPAGAGEDAITIEDGVALRNPPLGGA
jgi:Tfp pilus assembly protein PilW